MINIYEILKDKTEGIKLYCTLFGDVIVVPYKRESGFMVELSKGETLVHQIMDFDAFGRITETGECLIYPSKEQRDWSKFVLPAVLLLLPVLSVSPIFRYFWLHQNYRIRKHHLHLFFE